MEMLKEIAGELVEAFRASLNEVVFILAAIGAYDNRLELETSDTRRVPEALLPEPLACKTEQVPVLVEF